MLTTMVIVPEGPEPVADRIRHAVRKSFAAAKWDIKTWRQVKEPHLPTPSGTAYWVTLWEHSKKKIIVQED